MFHALKRPGRIMVATFSACLIIAAPACKNAGQSSGKNQVSAGGAQSAVDEYQQARQQLARASERLSKDLQPITDREELARKLKLSPDRFAAIKTGAQVTGPLVVAFDADKDCTLSGHCICFGDRSCNEMFSGICRSESTDGSCEGSGNETACSCEVEGATPVRVEEPR